MLTNTVGALPKDSVEGRQINKYAKKTGSMFRILNHGICQLNMSLIKPDIIHETYYSSLPCFNTKSIRITTVYDMIHELYKCGFRKKDLISQAKKETCDRVDHIICISQSTKADLMNIFGINESKISVVHLGVDVSVFQNQDESATNTERPYLLYVGNRSGYKNFLGFIKAVANSSRLAREVDIVAFGGGRFTTDEINNIKLLGFKDSQVKQISGDDKVLASFYSNAIAFVYPSLYEGFGLPPLEAMAAACPVVSSSTSSMPEVIGNAAVFFDPSDVDDMRQSIESVVFSETIRSTLIANGFKNIKSFSWGKCAQVTLDVYQKLTGAR